MKAVVYQHSCKLEPSNMPFIDGVLVSKYIQDDGCRILASGNELPGVREVG